MTKPRQRRERAEHSLVFDSIQLRNDITAYCAKSGKTLEDFYQIVGLSPSMHSKLTTTKRTPSALSLLLVCKTLGTNPLDYLVESKSTVSGAQLLVTAWAKHRVAHQLPLPAEQD